MTNNSFSTDFRAIRALLPDDVFLIGKRPGPGPTDLVPENVWNGIMHLPDDVAITTSDHHGAQLTTLYSLWTAWIEAIGDTRDELFGAMLDAADCFQSSTFTSLHGFYRSAVSNLRCATELMAIGTLGNLSRNDRDYLRWNTQNLGSLPFTSCIRKLRGVTSAPAKARIFKPNCWLEALYQELCAYAHSRPDSSDGKMWKSNGPIYVTAAFNLVFQLHVSVYAASYILTKVGRPRFTLPQACEFLFETSELLWGRDAIPSSYRALCSDPDLPPPRQ